MGQLHWYNKQGQLLVELLVALAVSAILIPAIMTGFIASRQGVAQARQRLEATALAREASDAVRIVRDAGWSNVGTNGTYHPVITNNTWTLASGPSVVNGYTESVVIADVSRDATGAIVTTGGTVDPSTKKVTVTVSWGLPIVSSVIETLYITRLTNLSWIQTTQADFDAGTKNNVITTHTWDGEVTLGAGGQSDWCSPNLSLTPLNLPGQGITTAISATTSANMDYAYTTTGGNSSGDSMDAVTITHTDPSVANNAGTYNYRKTYGIFVDNSNQYVYLTSDHPGLTVDIVQVATQPYTQTGTFSASQGGDGSSVTVAYSPSLGHDAGYVTAGNNIYAFDLASRTGSRPQLGFASLAGTGEKTIVVGNYAYVAVASNGEQLDIYDISNPHTPQKVSHIDVHNGKPATDLFVNSTGTRVYLVTQQASPYTNDFFIIDTTNKISTLPAPIGSFNTGAMSPRGVTVVPGNRAIIVGSGGEQYQVLNIATEASPVHCGGLTNPNGSTAINAVASVLRNDGSAYSYILTNSADKEFQMIAGGPGGNFIKTGIFESSTLDATRSAAFNRFFANSILPNNTTVEYQVSGADPVSNSCTGAAFTYIGPDGTSGTKFATGSAIPLSAGPGYKNPARCFRYKAFLLTKDPSAAPVFTDITVNYSP
jgi:type II secretory pathway pseudopilin PulG